MQELLKWLASLKGIEVEPGAELRLELTSFPSGGLALLVMLGILAALYLIVHAYRRDGNLSRGQRGTLAAMRGVAVLMALLVVLEPNLVAVKKDRREGHTIILLDLSQSMGHRDAFRHPDVQGLLQAWQKLEVEHAAGSRRIDLARALLSHDDYQLIKKLNEKNKVMLYGFGSGIEPLPLQLTAEDPDPNKPKAQDQDTEQARAPPLPDLDHKDVKNPGRKYTNLGGAVRAALDRSRNAQVAAVIVLSDGRRNLGAQGSEVARFLAQRKVDHTFIVGVGDPSEAQSVEVTRIEAPEKAFQKDPFKIRGTVASEGYDRQPLVARLIKLPDGGGAGTVLQSRQIDIGGDTPKVDIEFDNLKSDKAGVFTYRVEVEPPAGEPPNPERHGKQARVELLDEQTKVLLIAGSPLHEYQIVRNLLTRDRTIELTCWLLSADKDFPQDGNVSIKELPEDRKGLDPYDVFIFMDADHTKLAREWCDMVAKQIVDNGAGLWWVCGEKYTADAMLPTASTQPLVDLLPVMMNEEKANELLKLGYAFPQPWSYQLTPEGEDFKACRLTEASKAENAELWRQLPGWHFAFPVHKPKPAAHVLVDTDHPRLRLPEGPMALISTQFVGAGRILCSATDETYRWRSLYEHEYNRFWVKGIRYLFEGRLKAGNSRLRINVSADKVELGEAVKITAEVKDDAYQPLIAETYEVQLDRSDQASETVELRAVDGLPGQFEYMHRPTRTGFYTVVPTTKQQVPVEASFQVVAAAVEREGPVDLAELQAIAGTRGGELVKLPNELLAAVDSVPSRTTIETFRTPHAVWDSWVTIAVILTLLTIEWWLRKRWNLL
ncbi:MAG: hypothetical protein ACYTKC_11120 [Planctomycetota bacterium]|jgi:hypothetical protein